MLFDFMNVYAEPAAQAPSNPSQGGGLAMFFPLIVMVLVFWFFIIRPQKKKEKELKNMLAALKVGDEVATIGGIHGKIFRIKDELFILETGAGTNKSYVTVDRSAVSRFIRQAEENKVKEAPETEEKDAE